MNGVIRINKLLFLGLLACNFLYAKALNHGGETKEGNKNTTSVNQRALDKLEEQIDLHLQKHDFVKSDQLIEKWKKLQSREGSDSFYDVLFSALRGTNQEEVLQELTVLCKSDPDNLIYRYYLGIAHLHSGRFKEAEKVFGYLKSQQKISKQFRELVEEKWENSRNGSIYVINETVIIKAENDHINTDVDEYASATSVDGKVMAFTRYELADTANISGPKEVIYESHFNRHGELTQQLRLFPGNDAFHYSPLEYSFDKNTFYYYKGETHKTGNIHEAKRMDNTWIENGVVEGFINSPYWDSDITFSYDGSFAVFSSNRPGGYGGRDLYSATMQPDGTWGKITNLGPSINTEKNEDSPFFRKDDQMLYFSSNGHAGIGGMDVFYSKFENGAFSYPKNIGHPINTAGDDKYFSVNPTGRKAMYSSTIGKESNGGFDIYQVFNEPTCKNDPPNLTVLDVKIHGDVNDIVKIEIWNKENNVIFEGSLEEFTETNSFVLKNGTSYEIKLSGQEDNYSEWLDLTKVDKLHHTEKNIHFFGKNNVAVVSDKIISGPFANQNRQDYVLSVLSPDNGHMMALEFEDIPMVPGSETQNYAVTIFGKQYEQAQTLLTEGAEVPQKSEVLAKLKIIENEIENATADAGSLKRIPLKNTPYFKNYFEFNQVTVPDEKMNNKPFKDLVKTIEELAKVEAEIWIHLESRASKVPTSKSGGNNKLAYDRGKEFRLMLLKYLEKNHIKTENLKFTYDAKVTGPSYSKTTRINEYFKHQYVSIYLRRAN